MPTNQIIERALFYQRFSHMYLPGRRYLPRCSRGQSGALAALCLLQTMIGESRREWSTRPWMQLTRESRLCFFTFLFFFSFLCLFLAKIVFQPRASNVQKYKIHLWFAPRHLHANRIPLYPFPWRFVLFVTRPDKNLLRELSNRDSQNSSQLNNTGLTRYLFFFSLS